MADIEGKTYVAFYPDDNVVAIYKEKTPTHGDWLGIYRFGSYLHIWKDVVKEPGLNENELRSAIDDFITEWLQQDYLNS